MTNPKSDIKRVLNLSQTLEEMSLLLLGPRQTGKTTFLEENFSNQSEMISLLDPEIFRDLQKRPEKLAEIVNASSKKIFIIDEVQKIPELLDVVQNIIQKNKNIRFILTGSSARKLKSRSANLLGGRAYPHFMHPICSTEYLKNHSNFDLILQIGGLPSVLMSNQPQKRLKAYIGIYLQEEIKAEGLVRNLADFSRFLDVAALTNTEQLDYNSVASDAQLSARKVASYYQILQDTLIGNLLEPYRKTKTRKAVATAKFYFFDVGVANYLLGREKINPGTPEYGKTVEHFIFTELLAYKNYNEKEYKIYYWRSTSQFEVDFIIETKNKKLLAIEVKAKKNITTKDCKGIKAFAEDCQLSRKIVISLDEKSRLIEDKVEVFNLKTFCHKLWAGEIL